MVKSRRQFMTWTASMATLWLSGCAATANKIAVPYAIHFHGSENQNLSAQGEASPIQVQVYQLKAKDRFEAADYFGLQQQADELLGDQLLAYDSLMVQPEQTQQLESAGHVEARYVGIVAGYRELNQSQWRLVVPLPAAKSTNIYKFWQFSPSRSRLHVAVEKDRLQLVSV